MKGEVSTIHAYGAIILAGGKSIRMGHPKPWLRGHDGISFAFNLVRAYKAFGCKKIVFVINDAFCKSPWENQINEIDQVAEVVKNMHPERGRFYSLQLAVNQFNSTDFVFIHNVDNPFINLQLLEILKSKTLKNMYTVPTIGNKGGHPILVSGDIIQQISKFQDHTLNLRNVLHQYIRNDVAVPWKGILANINTMDRYEEYIAMASNKICH